MHASGYKQTLVNFLNENIQAVECCLNQTPKKGVGYQEKDVLGFPAAALLLSIIDAIGTIVKSSKKSFSVLNTDFFDNQNLDDKTLVDLYRAYRNPFLHNNLLLEGRFVINHPASLEIFYLDEKKENVLGINIPRLAILCKSAISKFEEFITEEKILASEKIKDNIDDRSLEESIEKLFAQFSQKESDQIVGCSDIRKQIELSSIVLSGNTNSPQSILPAEEKHD